MNKVMDMKASLSTKLSASADTQYKSTDITFFDGTIRKFYYRENTSDVAVIQLVLISKQYDLGRLRRSSELKGFLQRKRMTGKIPLIVDAGANIGASAIYFLSAVPDAQIVAIEPETRNFQLLALNTSGLRVETLRAAISSTHGVARVIDPGEGHWGYRTQNIDQADTATSVPRITINEIYRRHATRCFPWIVKIDIEGGELDLFLSNTEWVAATPILIIELHDKFLLQTANSRTFLQCVSQLNRDFVYIGEDIYSIANDLD
jgi:FkbM family methyltransferase